MTKMMTVAIALLLGACAVDAPRPHLDLVTDGTFEIVEPVEMTSLSPACDRIVATSGSCSVACDLTALAQYFAPNVCVLLFCELDDGTYGQFGGCL